ncbi:MAG: DUF2155 domain-containing protein [Erythrobacter sp.]|jgi:hypothetical protein
MRRALALTTGALLLAACDGGAPKAPAAPETEIPDALKTAPAAPRPAVAGEIGTPMNQRVATIGLLNKRNNVSQDLEMKPGEQRRVGDVIVRLQACERTAPWEMPKETGAFVQVLVKQRGSSDRFDRIFSGWLFTNSPSLNVVEHPIYDVWIKDCTMAFPGEELPANSDTTEGSDAEG